jgi:hypothetical protein
MRSRPQDWQGQGRGGQGHRLEAEVGDIEALRWERSRMRSPP